MLFHKAFHFDCIQVLFDCILVTFKSLTRIRKPVSNVRLEYRYAIEVFKWGLSGRGRVLLLYPNIKFLCTCDACAGSQDRHGELYFKAGEFWSPCLCKNGSQTTSWLLCVCVCPFWSRAIYLLGYDSGVLPCVTQRDFYCFFENYLSCSLSLPTCMILCCWFSCEIYSNHTQFVTSAAFRSYFPLICNKLRSFLSIWSCRFKCINDAVFYGVSGVLALWLGKVSKDLG